MPFEAPHLARNGRKYIIGINPSSIIAIPMQNTMFALNNHHYIFTLTFSSNFNVVERYELYLKGNTNRWKMKKIINLSFENFMI